MLITIHRLPHANIDPVDEAPTYELLEHWEAIISVNFRTIEIPIRKYFRFDGASIPRFARWLLERDGVHRESCLLHDYLYEKKGKVLIAEGEELMYERKDADRIFRKCLEFQGLASWKVFLMYHSVRLGGWTYWR